MRADKAKVSRLLKTARGQIDGILKMIEEDRYCIDISNQVLAAEAMLKKANREIIKGHMEGCIKEALEGDDGDKKIEEFLQTLDKLMK